MSPPPPLQTFDEWALKRNQIWRDKLKEFSVRIKEEELKREDESETTISL